MVQPTKVWSCRSLYDILTDERLNHRVKVETGILEAECQYHARFFRQRRESQKAAKLIMKAQEDHADNPSC